MNKGLEALEELQSEWEFDNNLPKGFVDTRVSIIEKELKALEIIKDKKVDTDLLTQSVCVMQYNKEIKNHFFKKALTQEEYDLLKEVLL